MKKYIVYYFYIIIFLFLSFNISALESLKNIPLLSSPVMDTANMMDVDTREKLASHLLEYSQEKRSQIVVLTVDKIAPESLFDYATRVLDTWKLGRKGVDDGVLLLLVKDERKIHIAVGRGLEGAIPDAVSRRIIANIITPYFKANDFNNGIINAVSQIEKLIAGENLAEPKDENKQSKFIFLIPFIILLMMLCFIFIKSDLLRSFALSSSGFIISLIAGAGIIASLMIFFFLFFFFLFGKGGDGGGNNWHSGSGGNSSGFGGGSFGGGSFGGGGFSGGGGSFGGGGASGSW